MASSLASSPLRAKAFSSAFQERPAGRCRVSVVRCSCSSQSSSRRELLSGAAAAAAAALVLRAPAAEANTVPTEVDKMLCDAECITKLEAAELVTLPSGLQYKDVVVGKGPKPPVGYQVVVNYVAMTEDKKSGKYRVFDSSLEKGAPYDIRVGAGQVIPGLDEALLTMQPGGLRRAFIPGPLAFPKNLKAAPGRPAIPAFTPVVFDLQLLYIPGLESDEE